MTFLRACAAVLPISISIFACDLEPKDIGNESESNGNSETGGTETGDDAGPACVDGDVMDAPDGCNTCGCENGEWLCTAIGCGDDATPICEDGDVMDAPDGCNTCTCEGNAWACTEADCNNDEAPVCEDGDMMDAPDGCNTCTCEGGAWACTEEACSMGWFGDEILVCDPGAPQDAFFLNGAVIVDDTLVVDLAYSGGCADHEFGMCWDGFFAESEPVQITSFIAHESHDDKCAAVPSEQLVFDLVPLKEAWQAAYGSENGEITINLAGSAPILYTF